MEASEDVIEVLSMGGPTAERHRLSRSQFERFLRSFLVGTEVVMEACGTAHHWSRRCHVLEAALE